jgi:hypothetical protein
MTLTSDGFKVAILNFDSSKYWDVSTSMGSSYVDDSGYLVVSEIDKAGTVVINLKVSADGFRTLAKTYTYDLPESSVVPQLAAPSNITNNSFDVRISNYDPSIKWTARTSAGLASLSSSGVVTISGLLPNQAATVTVAASAEGKRISTTTISGSAGAVFSSISEREWALIAKDPQGNIGKAIIIFGYITQFDAATGLNQFRADINGINSRTIYGFTGDNTFLTGDVQLLKNFVAKDYFTAKVIVKGSKTYTTTLNGSITVPSLEVVEISRS